MPYIPNNLCNQYAPNETAIMATLARIILGQDAECHVFVRVYCPSSTNSQAVTTPESTMHHQTKHLDHFQH